MKQPLILFALFLLLMSCGDKEKMDRKAHDIVEHCIEKHGGKNYRNMNVSFDFRQFNVHLVQKNGTFKYERTNTDSLGNVVHDVLKNDSFYREINGKQQDLVQKDIDKYREGLNAIAYFVLLPYKLSEPAVQLKYLGEASIENKKYYKIGVSFKAEGGGKDHHDEFCYWIQQNTYTLDYLAYSSGGPRFRKATKREKINGIIFQDYENYELTDSTLSTADYDKAFIEGRVKLLSKIEQKNYTTKRIPM